MNLNAYDKVEINYNNANWVDVRYRRLYSNIIPFYSFYGFLKRYNPNYKRYDYFILLTNNFDTNDIVLHSTNRKRDTIKIDLDVIWKHVLSRINCNSICNINLDLVEDYDDYRIYYLDI